MVLHGMSVPHGGGGRQGEGKEKTKVGRERKGDKKGRREKGG